MTIYAIDLLDKTPKLCESTVYMVMGLDETKSVLMRCYNAFLMNFSYIRSDTFLFFNYPFQWQIIPIENKMSSRTQIV